MSDSDLTKQVEAGTKQMDKMAAPAPTIMEALVKSYVPLDPEELLDYKEDTVTRLQTAQDYFSRRNAIIAHKEKTVPVRATAMNFTLPAEPALTNKERKNRDSLRASNLRKGRKLNPNATCFTVDILANEKARADAVMQSAPVERQLLDVMKKSIFSDPLTRYDRETQEKADEYERIWGPLMLLGPKLALDKDGKLTKESVDKTTKYASEMWTNFDKTIQAAADKMMAEQINPLKFTPEYICEHYDEVRDQLDRLKGYTQLFKPGTITHDKLSIIEMATADAMEEVCRLAEKAFAEALKLQGVTFHAGREATADAQGDQAASAAAVEELKKAVSGMRANVKENLVYYLEDDIEDEMAQCTDYDELHADMAKQPDMAFITMPLSSIYQYENLRDTKQLIDSCIAESPALYAQHKELIDSMMTEALELSQAMSHCVLKTTVLARKVFDTSIPMIVRDALSVTQDREMKKNLLLNARLCNIQAAVKHIFRGKTLGEGDALYLEEKGYKTDMVQDALAAAAVDVPLYKIIVEDKKDIFAAALQRVSRSIDLKKFETGKLAELRMLVQAGDIALNDKIAKVAIYLSGDTSVLSKDELAQTVFALIDEIKNYDTLSLESATDAELIEKQEELIEMSIGEQALRDLCALQYSDNPPQTMLEKYFSDHPDPVLGKQSEDSLKLDIEVFRSKQTFISAAMLKARGAALLSGIKYGKLDDSCLTDEEKEYVKTLPGAGEEQLIEFAKRQYASGIAMNKENELRIANSPVHKNFYGHGLLEYSYKESVHAMDGIFTQLQDEYQQARALSDHPATYSSSTFLVEEYQKAKAVYDLCLVDLEMEGITLEAKGELIEEMNKAKERMFNISVYYRLCVNGNYYLAGSDVTKDPSISDAILRSCLPLEQIEHVREMSEAQYNSMLEDLSAGTFLDKTSPQEEIDEAREANKRGIRKYFDAIAPHYDFLEKKYGMKELNYTYIAEHLLEIRNEMVTSQVDSNLVMKNPGVLDMNDEKDARFYHQVCYYSLLGNEIITLSTSWILAPGNAPKEFFESSRERNREMEREHKAYLMAHPMRG